MTRAGKFGEAVGVAAAKGLLWSVNRAFRLLGVILVVYIYASISAATGTAATRPSPLLVDATVSDLMWAAITPVITIIVTWRMLKDD